MDREKEKNLSKMMLGLSSSDIARLIGNPLMPGSKIGLAYMMSSDVQRALGKVNPLFDMPSIDRSLSNGLSLSQLMKQTLTGSHSLREQKAYLELVNQTALKLGDPFRRHREIFGAFDPVGSSIDKLMGSIANPEHKMTSLGSAAITKEMDSLAASLVLPKHLGVSLAERLGQVSNPWTVAGNEKASIAAAMHLAQVRSFMRELPAYSKHRSHLAGIEFGFFGQVLPIAEPIDDDATKEDIYTDAGRTPALVAFTSESYDEVLGATGWAFDVPQPDFIRSDGTILPAARIDASDHLLVSLVEAHLRAIVVPVILAAGDHSAMQRLFGPLVPNWSRKRESALARGEPDLHLLYYADFMELVQIVINNELWNSNFKVIFRHKERFKMKMELLHELRVQTAHSRPLGRTAKLRLLAETNEFLVAVGCIAP